MEKSHPHWDRGMQKNNTHHRAKAFAAPLVIISFLLAENDILKHKSCHILMLSMSYFDVFRWIFSWLPLRSCRPTWLHMLAWRSRPWVRIYCLFNDIILQAVGWHLLRHSSRQPSHVRWYPSFTTLPNSFFWYEVLLLMLLVLPYVAMLVEIHKHLNINFQLYRCYSPDSLPTWRIYISIFISECMHISVYPYIWIYVSRLIFFLTC